jgi:DNA topoisomerase-3
VARELISRGFTERAVTGFKGRSGRTFRARLALEQDDEGKWRVEFNEPWARDGKAPEAEGEEETADEGAAAA